MTSIEPHFMAVFLAANAACEMIDLLPDADLIDDLQDLLTMQFNVLVCMLEGKQYGTDNLDYLVGYAKDLRKQAIRLKTER